jgi:hypothetical protein
MNNTENKTESQPPLQASGVTIREAIQTDCPRLMELVHELALFEKAPEEVTVT